MMIVGTMDSENGGNAHIRIEIDSLAGAHPSDILSWAVEHFGGRIAASSSFQTQSVPLLHMISRVTPDLPVVFLDTGFHFPETLAFRDRLVEEWGLNLRIAKPGQPHEGFILRHGPDLYRRDPDLCCYVNKVEPMRRAMQGLDAWISGVRRDQTAERSGVEVVERRDEGPVRIHPLAAWTEHDVWQYMADHDLPEHPLLAKGYLSIGCAPCTRPVLEGQDPRSGRWAGTEKTECGLHTVLRTAPTEVTEPHGTGKEGG